MRRLLALLVLVGCSGDDSPVHHPPDAPGGGDGGGVAENVLTFEKLTNGVASAAGAFYADPIQYNASCSPTTYGDCQVFSCQQPVPTNTAKNAGDVAISGGTAGLTYMLTHSTANSYSLAGQTSLGTYFPAGTSVTFSASGDEFPAFSSSLMVPDLAQLDAPVMGSTQSRGSDLTFAWSSASGISTVSIYVSSSTSLVQCTFATSGATGTGVVPASALSALPAGVAFMGVSAYAKKIVTAGDNEVTLYAGGDLYNSTHTGAASGGITLQ